MRQRVGGGAAHWVELVRRARFELDGILRRGARFLVNGQKLDSFRSIPRRIRRKFRKFELLLLCYVFKNVCRSIVPYY
jgi:hypothetical protein